MANGEHEERQISHRNRSRRGLQLGACLVVLGGGRVTNRFDFGTFWLLAESLANATFYTEGFSSFVASTAALIATWWSEPVPGRDCSPAEDQRLFTRTPVSALIRWDEKAGLHGMRYAPICRRA